MQHSLCLLALQARPKIVGRACGASAKPQQPLQTPSPQVLKRKQGASTVRRSMGGLGCWLSCCGTTVITLFRFDKTGKLQIGRPKGIDNRRAGIFSVAPRAPGTQETVRPQEIANPHLKHHNVAEQVAAERRRRQGQARADSCRLVRQCLSNVLLFCFSSPRVELNRSCLQNCSPTLRSPYEDLPHPIAAMCHRIRKIRLSSPTRSASTARCPLSNTALTMALRLSS